MNPKMPRWSYASIHVAVKAIADANNIPFYYEGMEIHMEELEYYIELRVDGPVTLPLQGMKELLQFEVNILITVKDPNNLYKVPDIAGPFLTNSMEIIHVYQYNDGGSFVGCLKRRPILRGDRPSVHRNFGIVEKDTKVQQAIVEAHYEIIV